MYSRKTLQWQAEVIEIGLERFGILEGVIDGGDEVEDKTTKRRSFSRVRYELAVNTSGQGVFSFLYVLRWHFTDLHPLLEKELSPSSKVIDAYSRPPTYKAVDRRFQDSKRRSVDSAQLLGTIDNVSSEDPIFVLRRVTSYRNSTSRHRMSAPLDELALRNLHRESQSSNASSEPLSPRMTEGVQQQQPSRTEIIAVQREASRANQRAIDDRMRYSYVFPDGATYDISDIVEEEWREASNKSDLLEGVVGRGGGNEKLDRVLNKIKKGQGMVLQKQIQSSSLRSNSVSSAYLFDETVDAHPTRSRSATPLSGAQSVLIVDFLDLRSRKK